MKISRTLLRPAVVCLAVFVAHALYYAWPEGSPRRWAAYVLQGVAFAALCLMLCPRRAEWTSEAGALGAFGSAWGVLEGGQQAVCGVVGWGKVSVRDVCVDAIGSWPYVVAAAGLCAALVVSRLRSKK